MKTILLRISREDSFFVGVVKFTIGLRSRYNIGGFRNYIVKGVNQNDKHTKNQLPKNTL